MAFFSVFMGIIVGLILEPIPGAVVAMVGIAIIAVLSPWLLFSPIQMSQTGFKFTTKALVGGIWFFKFRHMAYFRCIYVWNGI